ncbi:MAG TPA: hypothetical protein VHN59_08970 [Chitinophagaceae bacterium]|jgi:anaerobic C4-dicarboxylate transporter|nr:hypothetical protein [Chitinophagaceae bacterium]
MRLTIAIIVAISGYLIYLWAKNKERVKKDRVFRRGMQATAIDHPEMNSR